MSEDAVISEAPASTASIAETVIDQYESSDTPAEGTDLGESTPVETAAEAPAPGVVQPPLSDEEKLLAEFGFKDAKKPDGRDHYIPRPKVLKMIASGLKRGAEKWTQERTALEGQVTPYREAYETLRPFVAALEQGPEAFLREAGAKDPRYLQFLERASAPPPPSAPVLTHLPEPDFQLPDGSKTYSIKGIQEGLIPYLVQQARAQAKEEAEAALRPITEREKAAAEQARLSEADTALRARTQATLKDAQTWPLFGSLAADGSLNDVQAAVLAELQKDTEAAKAAGRRPTMTLEGAYIKVTSARVAEDATKQRERLLKEINAAAKASPTVARAGAESVRPGRPASTSEIAARAIDRLERGA